MAKPTDDVAKHSLSADAEAKGHFVRSSTLFHSRIGSSEFPAEAGRYRLYVSWACPWASRTLAVRALKGLEDAIPVTYLTHELPNIQETKTSGFDLYRGWRFQDGEPHGWEFIDELYEYASPGYREAWQSQGKRPTYSVPVLFDEKTKRIVNTESSEIIKMLNSEFNSFAKNPDLDLDPEVDRAEAELVNDDVYPHVNDGVYRCGFARSQEAYDDAVGKLFACLDRMEARLATRRYLTGPRLNLADVRLFVTLVRMDPVYVQHFKVNRNRLVDFPNLLGFTREIYQLPGIRDTVNFESIRKHYHTQHRSVNKFGIIPIGMLPDMDAPHGRHGVGTFTQPLRRAISSVGGAPAFALAAVAAAVGAAVGVSLARK